MTKSPVLHIDIESIVSNWQRYNDLCPTAEVSAVIKANAYGTGAVKIYEALSNGGCKTFWVASLSEALEIKAFDAKANVNVLGGISDDSCEDFVKHNITPVLNTIEQLELWARKNTIIPAWIQLNTSLNRFGISPNMIHRVQEILSTKTMVVAGYLSHLLAGEETENSINAQQKKNFDAMLSILPPAKASLCNTAGTFLGSDYHYDIVRVGIGLYGIQCSDSTAIELEFENPLTLQAPVQNIHNITAGEGVGYNATFVAEEDMSVATIGIGYADGINYALSNNGTLYFAGQILPIIGTVSMDSMAVDVSSAPFLKEGHMVTVFDSADDISIISLSTGTPQHTVLASLLNRIVRQYT